MKRLRSWKFLLLLAILVVSALGYLFWPKSEKANDRVATAKVSRGTLEIVASSSGVVEADIQIEVKSRASGEVIAINAEAGDSVVVGTLLVKLDPADEERRVLQAEADAATARSRLAKAHSALSSARADLLEAEGRLERRRRAHASGLVSGEELAAAVTAAMVSKESLSQNDAEIRSAEAEVLRADLAIAETRKRLDETIIKAPISGTVLAVNVERGSIVASGITNVGGGTALVTLADLSKLYVVVKLDEASIGAVKSGQEVRIRVDAWPDRFFKGEVARVTPLGVSEANIVTFDVKVRITDKDAKLLLPGMSTDVEIVTEVHRDVILAPAAAFRPIARIPAGASENRAAGRPNADAEKGGGEKPRGGSDRTRRSNKRLVLIANGDEREVTVGPSDGVRTVVLEGLSEGEEIIVSGGQTGDEKAAPNPMSRIMGGGRR